MVNPVSVVNAFRNQKKIKVPTIWKKGTVAQQRAENRMTHGCSMRQFSGDRVLGTAVSLIAGQFVAAEVSI